MLSLGAIVAYLDGYYRRKTAPESELRGSPGWMEPPL
jgi:hypothetical protein